MRREKPLELGGRQDETAERRLGNDVGNRHLAEQAGNFTEVIAGFQHAAVDIVDPDPGRPLEDDVEARSAYALAEDALALAKEGLIEKVRHLLELRPAQVRKEGEGR